MKYFVTPDGEYLGGFANGVPVVPAIEVPKRPSDIATWDGAQWQTVPLEVSKLALIRACRATEWGEGTLWDAVKAALANASNDVHEDWEAAQSIPRTDPYFLDVASALANDAEMSDADKNGFIDDVFVLASRQEVT